MNKFLIIILLLGLYTTSEAVTLQWDRGTNKYSIYQTLKSGVYNNATLSVSVMIDNSTVRVELPSPDTDMYYVVYAFDDVGHYSLPSGEVKYIRLLEPIPTVSEWGLIVLGLMLMMLGYKKLKRKRR